MKIKRQDGDTKGATLDGKTRGTRLDGRSLKAWAGMALLLAEALLVLVSWLLSATMPDGGVRSLLSSEGIRWFFGTFTQHLASPVLVWLLLLLVSLGCLQRSGLLGVMAHLPRVVNYRDRIALRLSMVFLGLYVAVILLLTVFPHAILLSATGQLFPSAFSRSLVPVIAFGVAMVGVAFGIMSGRFVALADVLDALSFGIAKGAWVFVIYILLVQLCASLAFVFF